MSGDDLEQLDPSDTLVVPFIFVPHGYPPPDEWLAAHPGAIKIPAVLIPRPATNDAAAGWHVNLDLADALTRSESSVPSHSTQPPDPTAPVLLVDDHGMPVLNAHGRQMLRPAGLDPNFFVEQGLKDGRTEVQLQLYGGENGTAAALGYEYAALRHFRRGGPWDAQRVGGRNREEYVDYATVAIGLYAAAAGMSRSDILEVENLKAMSSHYAPGTKFDAKYTYLPERNVDNTELGFRLFETSRIGPYVGTKSP